MLCWIVGPAIGALPDHRGYELVSPPDKNGGDVLLISSRTYAAAGGDAAVFSSLVGFGDVKGTTIAGEYMAVRTAAAGTSGWSTHGISPKQPPLTFFGAFVGRDPRYDYIAPDLSRGVYRAFRPLTDAPNVAELLNLYKREDLRSPGDGAYQLISDAPIPVDPGPFARFASVTPIVAGASTDLSVVAFESTVTLVPEASGSEVKLYQSVGGRLMLAGILPNGDPGASSQAGQSAFAQHFTPGTVSPDGSRVFFQSPAGTSGGIYMRVDGARTIQLNVSEKRTPEAPGEGRLWLASKDGSRVFFSTSEGLVDGDDDGGSDLYMYDVNAAPGEHLMLVSVDAANGPTPDSIETVIGASDDGRYVYFINGGELVAGQPPVLGRPLYVWHDGTVRWLGEFVVTGDSDAAGLGTPSVWAPLLNIPDARVTPDGRHLLFMTRSDAGFVGHGGFIGYDHGSTCTFDDFGGLPCRELYVYNDATNKLRCASCHPRGAPATAEAFANMIAGATSGPSLTSHLSHALSDDGRRVFFSTREALVPEDINGRFDAYEYDTVDESVQLISTGRATSDSYFLDASASGRDVFFATRERLVGWDIDDSFDLYDARVGGGLPEPVAAPPVCVGEACQGALGAAPATGPATSNNFRGRGDLGEKLKKHRKARARKKCRRGTRRVVRRGRVRCVRRKAGKARTGGFAYPEGGVR